MAWTGFDSGITDENAKKIEGLSTFNPPNMGGEGADKGQKLKEISAQNRTMQKLYNIVEDDLVKKEKSLQYKIAPKSVLYQKGEGMKTNANEIMLKLIDYEKSLKPKEGTKSKYTQLQIDRLLLNKYQTLLAQSEKELEEEFGFIPDSTDNILDRLSDMKKE